jgi:N-methylhydantoinase B/oxoprolinase/acetone carboxylase alpha subunit
LEFLSPMKVSLLSERRTRAPFGLAGGGPGHVGRNFHNEVPVGGKAALEVETGDVVRIETPGGGGFGPAGDGA